MSEIIMTHYYLKVTRPSRVTYRQSPIRSSAKVALTGKCNTCQKITHRLLDNTICYVEIIQCHLCNKFIYSVYILCLPA